MNRRFNLLPEAGEILAERDALVIGELIGGEGLKNAARGHTDVQLS